MANENKAPLTSSETSYLWTLFNHDTLIANFKKYTIAKAEDEQIKRILQRALDISDKRSKNTASIFSSYGLPVPVGFSDKDVNIDAPRLFSDTFALYHVLTRARLAMIIVATALSVSVQPDVRKLFQDAMTSSVKLNEDATQVALNKGLLIHSPIVSIPQEPYFVEKQSYLGSIFEGKRPMHINSLTQTFILIQQNILGRALITGFSQVAKDPEVKKFFLRGAEIGTKHIEVLSSILSNESIPIPQSPDSMVTDSVIAPFSDYLMMNHIVNLNLFNVSDLAIAIALTQRTDIVADFVRLGAEIAKYGEDGMKILIKNKWMEAPPQVIYHKEMATSGNINR